MPSIDWPKSGGGGRRGLNRGSIPGPHAVDGGPRLLRGTRWFCFSLIFLSETKIQESSAMFCLFFWTGGLTVTDPGPDPVLHGSDCSEVFFYNLGKIRLNLTKKKKKPKQWS